MKALTYDEYGDLDVLHVADVPEPHAGPGQVRVRVSAASINPIDWKLVSGARGGQPLTEPGIPGFDAAGVVDEVGDGVTGVAVGDDVFGLGSHTQAELAVLDAWAAKPASLDWAVAAAAGVALETAERGLRLLGVKPGDTLFVDGGAGGVGAVVVQAAVALGLTVIASAGQDNQDYLREIGATPVLYGQGLVNRVQAIPDARVDAVFDVAGKTPVADLLALAPEPGRVLSIANFDLPAHGGIATGGGDGQSRPFDALSAGASLLEQSRVVIKVQTFPLDRAVEAYRTSAAGHLRGKLVLLP
jgi:NADPH:quinone reductase-like Zn-dependent oxidoreductase